MIKTTLLAFTAACIFLMGNMAFAQSKKTVRDSTTVIIFNQSSTPKSGYKHKSNGEQNIIKIAPLGFVSGTFPILYERSITDFFSVQVGLGITSKNYIRSAIYKDGGSIKKVGPAGQEYESNISETLYNYDYRAPKLGYMFNIQPRVYFASDGLEGSYLGISYNALRYNFEIPGIKFSPNGYSQTGDKKSEHENLNDIMVHFGSQILNDKITFEYATSLGIRNVSGTAYYANNTGYEGTYTYKQSVFNYNIELRVGYHF